MKLKKRGMTLVELITSIIVFLLIAMLAYTFFYNTFHSTRGGTLKVRVREDARVALMRITDELREATYPPPNNNFTPPSNDSPVLNPRRLLNIINTAQATGDFASPHDMGLVFIKADYPLNFSTDYGTLARDPTKFLAVRYYVPFDSKNKLYRVVYNFKIFSDACLDEDKKWIIKHINPTLAKIKEEIIVELPDPNDTITLLVTHATSGLESAKIFQVTVIVKRAVWQGKTQGRDKEITLTSTVHVLDQTMENY